MQLERAIPLYKANLRDRERVLGADHPHTLFSRDELAGAYESAGDLNRAIPLFEQNLAYQERALGVGNLHTLFSLDRLATAYESTGQRDRAVALLQAALSDYERGLGDDNPIVNMIKHNLECVARGGDEFRHVVTDEIAPYVEAGRDGGPDMKDAPSHE